MKVFLVALLMTISCVANAKDCDDAAASMAETRDCQISESEKTVQIAYNQLLQALQEEDRGEAVRSLIISQNQWISRKNSTCEQKAELTAKLPSEVVDCYLDFNEARAAKLKSMLRNFLSSIITKSLQIVAWAKVGCG